MSWNKNTLNNSSIDNTSKILDDNNIDYTVRLIGQVKGFGLNDDLFETDEPHSYDLYELKYINKKGETIILRDQMIRTYDCDFDDIIETHEFINQEPDIKLEIYEHDDGFECNENCNCKI